MADPNANAVLALIDQGDLAEAKRILWQPGNTLDWLVSMAQRVEEAGDHHAAGDKARAIWCYEQAKALFECEASGATSGGEGMMLQMQNPGSHLGRKIWMLKS